MSDATATLPGFEIDPNTLPPVRPSYSKLVRQLEAAAAHHGIPVRNLEAHHIAAYAVVRTWSESTVATLHRVAHAHGLDIEPVTGRRVLERPNIALAPYTSCSPTAPEWQKRIAALAALTWRYPATMHTWTRLMWSDVELEPPTVAGRSCPGTYEPLHVWRDAVVALYPGIPDDRLPLFVRLDGRLLAAGARALQLDWARWFHSRPELTYDRYRAWAVDAGAAPVDRGATRPRYVASKRIAS